MARRCRSVQGVRSARNEYRHPGVPGTRNNGSPASSPNSDQATIRPSGRSRLRSRTPSRTASVTIGNPYKALGRRQAKRRRRPAGGCPRFRAGEPRTGPQNTVPREAPAAPGRGPGTGSRDPSHVRPPRALSPPLCRPWNLPPARRAAAPHAVPGSRTVIGPEPTAFGQAGSPRRRGRCRLVPGARHVRAHTASLVLT